MVSHLAFWTLRRGRLCCHRPRYNNDSHAARLDNFCPSPRPARLLPRPFAWNAAHHGAHAIVSVRSTTSHATCLDLRALGVVAPCTSVLRAWASASTAALLAVGPDHRYQSMHRTRSPRRLPSWWLATLDWCIPRRCGQPQPGRRQDASPVHRRPPALRLLRLLMCGFAMETQLTDRLGPPRGQSSTGIQRAEEQLQRTCIDGDGFSCGGRLCVSQSRAAVSHMTRHLAETMLSCLLSGGTSLQHRQNLSFVSETISSATEIVTIFPDFAVWKEGYFPKWLRRASNNLSVSSATFARRSHLHRVSTQIPHRHQPSRVACAVFPFALLRHHVPKTSHFSMLRSSTDSTRQSTHDELRTSSPCDISGRSSTDLRREGAPQPCMCNRTQLVVQRHNTSA
jgi:hypothetical protein